MRRSIVLLGALSLFLALPAAAQQFSCNLGMVMTCNSSEQCSATVTNNGSNTCSGTYFALLIVYPGSATGTNSAVVNNFQTSLGLTQCFSNGTLPGILSFGFGACTGPASLGPGNSFTMSGDVTLNGAPASQILGATEVVDPTNTKSVLGLAYQFNTNAAPALTCTPIASVFPIAQSGAPYTVSWSAVSDPSATFTIDESTAPDFSANLVSTPVSGNTMTFQHTATAATTYYYRVRANTCSGAPGANSPTVSIVIQPVPTVTGRSGDVTTPFGSNTPVSMNVFVPGPIGKTALDVPFTASTDKPYLTVTPSSGTIPPGGTTVTVTANPSGLPPGANSGTLHVTSNGTTTSTTVSVSLTTPVAPGTKTLPPANSLIIPVVVHAPGALGPFQSDVRLFNGNTASVNYQLTYTPTGTDGTTTGKTTTIAVAPGQSIALNDILNDFFGVGSTGASGDQGFGALELRPLNNSTTLNYASSRTFTFNPNGTYGQFITAIPFANFATEFVLPNPTNPNPAPPPTPHLSLQQVAQSSAFRTNIGLVEGSGVTASGHITLYDDNGNQVASVPYSLKPGEHVQNSFGGWGLPNINDGRLDVSVESPAGAVSAYASVLDNITNDPLAVAPVQASQISATRFILPGMAALGGTNNFHSDIRLYNGGTGSVTLNATYYPQNNGTPVPASTPITIGPGAIASYNDVIEGPLFNAPGNGGSVVFTSTAPASVVATGRTYTIASNNGTFGQFIPGITPSQGIGAGDRPMQLLQLEESANFRTNLGIAELTGNPVTVTISGYSPDSKVAATAVVNLGANQFTQLGHILAQLFPGESVYNGRATVQVTGGTGRIAAYGSVIDNGTNAGAYVPSQQ